MWEMPDGELVMAIPVTYSCRHGELPVDIDYELISISPTGERTKLGEATYKPSDVR
jgi:hypothetical protein